MELRIFCKNRQLKEIKQLLILLCCNHKVKSPVCMLIKSIVVHRCLEGSG